MINLNSLKSNQSYRQGVKDSLSQIKQNLETQNLINTINEIINDITKFNTEQQQLNQKAAIPNLTDDDIGTPVSC